MTVSRLLPVSNQSSLIGPWVHHDHKSREIPLKDVGPISLVVFLADGRVLLVLGELWYLLRRFLHLFARTCFSDHFRVDYGRGRTSSARREAVRSVDARIDRSHRVHASAYLCADNERGSQL